MLENNRKERADRNEEKKRDSRQILSTVLRKN